MLMIQWINKSISGLSYSVDVFTVINITARETGSVQLQVLYNVSITSTLCSQNRAITSILLNFGEFFGLAYYTNYEITTVTIILCIV